MQQTNLLDKYLFIDIIGSGSFGEVYLAVHPSGGLLAGKVEDKKKLCSNDSRIVIECEIYKDLHKNGRVLGIPKLIDFIETPKVRIMYMQLLGFSLEDIFNKCNRKFKLHTVIVIGEQIINLLEIIHSMGYIHRDIKPNNFLIGINSHKTQIYITDFGLSKKYIKNNKHIPFNTGRSLIGTARYASINIHMGNEPSRRDDLESIGYMLVYFLKGILPWQGLKRKGKNKREYLQMIGVQKLNTKVSDLCKNLPPCFEKYIKYCKKLGFSESPDYEYLKNLFINERIRLNLPYIFEWLETDKIPLNNFNLKVC